MISLVRKAMQTQASRKKTNRLLKKKPHPSENKAMSCVAVGISLVRYGFDCRRISGGAVLRLIILEENVIRLRKTRSIFRNPV